jgi:hypothetical protein
MTGVASEFSKRQGIVTGFDRNRGASLQSAHWLCCGLGPWAMDRQYGVWAVDHGPVHAEGYGSLYIQLQRDQFTESQRGVDSTSCKDSLAVNNYKRLSAALQKKPSAWSCTRLRSWCGSKMTGEQWIGLRKVILAHARQLFQIMGRLTTGDALSLL